MRISDWSSDVCSSDLWQVEGDAAVLLLARVVRLVSPIVEHRGAAAVVEDLGGEHLEQGHLGVLGITWHLVELRLVEAGGLVVLHLATQLVAALLGDRGDRKSTRLNSSH